jgi:hypothetical protein
MAEIPFNFMPPGGQFQDVIGNPLNAGTVIAPDHMVHHISTTAIINTITPPHEGYTGPLYLIADSLFTWTTAGNIGTLAAAAPVVGRAYAFLYDRVTGKWYGLGT